MKNKLINAIFGAIGILALLLFLWGAIAFAQKPRALVPVRISITASAGDDWDLRKDILRELQKLRNVVVVKESADIAIQLSAERFQGECRGVIVAVLTTTRSGTDLQALAGQDWREVAGYLAARIKQDIEEGK